MNNSSESTNKATSTGCAVTDRRDDESGTPAKRQIGLYTDRKPKEDPQKGRD